MLISTENALKEYLIKNPIDRSKRNAYLLASQQFKVPVDRVRRIYRTLRENKLVENDFTPNTNAKIQFKENAINGQADVTVITSKRIKTLADLLSVCEVDQKEWEVISYEVNKWEVGRKDTKVNWEVTNGQATGTSTDSGRINVEPLFQVKAKLSRRKIGKDLGLQKEALLAELKGYSPKVTLSTKDQHNFLSKSSLLEVCIFDPHFGKLCWGAETGEDYDLKIAESRVKSSIKELLSRVNLNTVQKILLPIGNDLINVDNKNNTTTAGTPQDTDVRFMKIIKVVRRILIEIIDDLSIIAPVDVVIVPGNHDTSAAFMMGEILEAFFYNNQRINVDNSPKLRKYYRYGLNSFQFTHGNEERHESLGLIFANEEPHLWAATKFRFSQLGHFHKNKKINYVSVDEHQGFQVQTLPSLSGIDAWHFKKGYNTLHQAKAFLFDEVKGLIGEFTTTA